MKDRTITFIEDSTAVLAVIAVLFFATSADATPPNKNPPKPPKVDIDLRQDQHQDTQVATDITTDVDATGGDATASNDGNTLETGEITVEGDSVENNSSNVVLVPNNNTESCVRVFGLAFGRNGESGALGVPWRSKACDYEQAADDAFAAGERELGWFWKCHNKSLAKPFKGKDESWESAIQDCHAKAVGEVTNMRTIESLKSELEFIENERKIARQKCSESKQRIKDTWKDSCGK